MAPVGLGTVVTPLFAAAVELRARADDVLVLDADFAPGGGEVRLAERIIECFRDQTAVVGW